VKNNSFAFMCFRMLDVHERTDGKSKDVGYALSRYRVTEYKHDVDIRKLRIAERLLIYMENRYT
jgi:hypothetical protein